MRNFKNGFLAVLLFFLIFGCTKDSQLLDNPLTELRITGRVHQDSASRRKNIIYNYDDGVYVKTGRSICLPTTRKLGLNQILHDKILNRLRDYSSIHPKELNGILNGTVITSVDEIKGIVQHSILINVNYSSISRYIFTENKITGDFISDAVLIAQLAPGYVQQTLSNNVALIHSIKDIKIYNAEKYFERNNRNPCPETSIEECYKIVNPLQGGGGGGSGTGTVPGTGSGNEGGTGSGTGGGGIPCTFEIGITYTQITPGCDPNGTGVGSQLTVVNVDCPDILFKDNIAIGSRDLTDCQMILISVGVMSNLELA